MTQNILITGASSGLGAALALVYAEPETALFLLGRNEERLQEVAHQAEAKGAKVETALLDVTDAAAMAAWIKRVDAASPLDLVIANAGVSLATGGGYETAMDRDGIFAVNLYGVFNTIDPVVDAMKMRRCGQIAIMASLAGFRGFAGAPAYMASKAAARVYGEGLRGDLAPYDVWVNVICPGFVKTPMTEVNDFPMPFLMTPEKAAQIIKRGLARNKPRITFPWPMVALVWLLASLPPAWIDPLLAKLPRK